MSTHLGLFYALELGNRVHCTFISTFSCSCFLRVFFVWNANNLETNLFDTKKAAEQVDLGVIFMKEYSPFFIFLEQSLDVIHCHSSPFFDGDLTPLCNFKRILNFAYKAKSTLNIFKGIFTKNRIMYLLFYLKFD